MSANVPSEDYVRKLALKYAVQNALRYGSAKVEPVIGKMLAEDKQLRMYIRDVIPLVKSVVEEVNRKSESELRVLASELGIAVEVPRSEEKKVLPPLPNVEAWGQVRTRFAPNPDFYIHIGNARAAIISHEYARMYKGVFVLRFEDTDPRIKNPVPEAYNAIREDLKWLGIRWDEEYIQSLRMDIYYSLLYEAVKLGVAYVDLCKPEVFREYRLQGRSCPHRNEPPEVHLERLDKIIKGSEYGEGEAVVRIKTDLSHPDPSVRDWVAFRIIDTEKNPHPITGSKYRLWPTYNFAAAVDDHLMGVSHIFRGREHATNTVKQMYLYKAFGWRYPEVVSMGRVGLEDAILSKSKIKEAVMKSRGAIRPDDPRFGTIAALRRRGVLPEAIREIILELGTKPSDAALSWKNIAAVNRKLLDKRARRVFVVLDPVKLIVEGLELPRSVELKYHPEVDLGSRRYIIDGAEFYIGMSDAKTLREGHVVRLMEFANIVVTSVELDKKIVYGKFHSSSVDEALKANAKIIQWVPVKHAVDVILERVEGRRIVRDRGLGEKAVASDIKEGEIVQLIRIGFGRIDRKHRNAVNILFAHE